MRSLGFVRENAGNLTGARPSTKNLTRLIPKDQRGPLHPSVPPTPNLQLSAMLSPFKTPLAHSTASALGSTQVHVGKKDVSFYDPPSGGLASPRSPRHQDFVPAIPATYRWPVMSNVNCLNSRSLSLTIFHNINPSPEIRRTLGDTRQAAHLELFNRYHNLNMHWHYVFRPWYSWYAGCERTWESVKKVVMWLISSDYRHLRATRTCTRTRTHTRTHTHTQ